MGFFDYLLAGATGLAGGLENRGGVAKTTQNTPVFDPATTNLRNNIISETNDMLTQDPNLEGYKAGQVSNINRNSDLEKQKILENAAMHGVSGPALDTSLEGADSRRFAGITNLNQTVPLQALNMRQQILQNANGIFASSPRSQTTTISQPSNKLGGFVTGLAASLARLHGLGAFNKKPNVNMGPPQDLPPTRTF